MGFDRDDPRLTAYALGEMSEGERTAFEKMLASDASLAAEVKAIASLGRELEAELDRHAPEGLGDTRRGDIVAAVRGTAPSPERTKLRVVEGSGERAKVTPPVTTPASSMRWRIWAGVSGLAVAAAALFFVSTREMSMKGSSPAASAAAPQQANAAATAMAKSPAAKPEARFGVQAGDQPAGDDGTSPKAKDRGELTPEATASAAPPCDASDPWCGHKGGPLPAGFVSTAAAPTSSFTLDTEPGMVEVASALRRGIVPARSDVHIGGMVNAFHYSYPAPQSGYALATDVASAPWEPSHRVLRVGVQGPRSGVAPPIEGNRVTVAFDGKSVVAYRFVGDGHAASATDSDGRATPTTGGSFTALFEVVPQRGATPSAPEHLADVSLHYADRSGQTLGVSTRADDSGAPFAGASSDFRFAVSVAGFGLLLSGDAGPRYSYDDVVTMATAARGSGFDGAGGGFIDMVQSAKALSKK